jgi:hypothetical protein
VPTRKQRRRRQKERRHEYEYVYVDDEGREVEVDEDERQPEPASRRDPRRNGKHDSTKARSSARPPRKVDPPSWARSFRRAVFFGIFIFVAFGFINNKESLQGRLALTVIYTAFFIPFMYLMDRAMYRAYLRRTGNQPAPPPKRRR